MKKQLYETKSKMIEALYDYAKGYYIIEEKEKKALKKLQFWEIEVLREFRFLEKKLQRKLSKEAFLEIRKKLAAIKHKK